MICFHSISTDRIQKSRNYKFKVTTAIWKKGTIHVANPLVAAERITTIQIKKLAKVTNDLRTHLGLPAYTKQTLIRKTSTEKTKESKSENTSERESSNNEMKNKNSNEDTETSSNDNE